LESAAASASAISSDIGTGFRLHFDVLSENYEASDVAYTNDTAREGCPARKTFGCSPDRNSPFAPTYHGHVLPLGVILFLCLRFLVDQTPENAVPGFVLILSNFFLYFAFAANVFFVLLVLHSVQWVVSSRIRTHSLSMEITQPT
jgi:hypothetical protein